MDIYREVSRYLDHHGGVNIVIAGQTCSGKTTLANRLRDCFCNTYSVTIVSQDDYFKNIDDIPFNENGYLMECPDAFHVSEFTHDVHIMLYKSITTMPRYDISTNTRIDKQKFVRAGQVNIFEGLHTIDLLSLNNSIKIYLDTDIDVCLKRRIERDTKLLNVSEKQVIDYWNNCIQPTSTEFIHPQINKADFVLWRW